MDRSETDAAWDSAEQPRTCGPVNGNPGCERFESDAYFAPDVGDCHADLPVCVTWLIKSPYMTRADTDATDCPCYVAKTGATQPDPGAMRAAIRETLNRARNEDGECLLGYIVKPLEDFE